MVPTKADFWVSATLTDVSINVNCLRFSPCAIEDSAFQLSYNIPAINASKSDTFSIFNDVKNLTFVNFWKIGDLETFIINLSIVKNMGGKLSLQLCCDETIQKILIEELVSCFLISFFK